MHVARRAGRVSLAPGSIAEDPREGTLVAVEEVGANVAGETGIPETFDEEGSGETETVHRFQHVQAAAKEGDEVAMEGARIRCRESWHGAENPYSPRCRAARTFRAEAVE
ncbi:MAG: hypothetical protein U5Q44_15815 [Dehalococcoidia bacterium]|nr:hypothetical protein [Dehalococcoidia bacterium]